MKNIAFLLLFVSVFAFSETLIKSDLAGTWQDGQCHGFNCLMSWYYKSPSNKLEITDQLQVKFTRHFASGNDQVFVADASSFTFIDDLIIIKFKNESGNTFKLVLSGWKIKSGKMLFGQLYLYNENGLFNGIPISLVPSSGS